MFNTLLFGIGISKFSLDIDNEIIRDFIYKHKCMDEVQLDSSSKELSDLNSIVFDKCQEILDSTAEGHTIKLKKMWWNHGFNENIDIPHNHRNSFLSCVYYPLSTDGAIQFYSPFTDFYMAHIPMDNVSLNHYTASHYNLPVKTGDLVIFNSMLLHRALIGQNERMSIAYDIDLL